MGVYIFALLVFIMPAAARAQESGLLRKFQDLPWQKNEAVGEDPDAPAGKGFGGYAWGAKIGPRFEGWYTRVTDRDGGRTFAFIAGSFLPAGIPFSPTQPLPGYLAVLISDGAGGPLKVYETFPEKTGLSINGKRVFNESPLESCLSILDPDCPRSGFAWTAQGYGHVNDRDFELSIPGEISIKGNFGAPVNWGSSRSGSPEGFAVNIPAVPIHWHVHSLGSPCDYEYNIQRENISLRSSGYAHIEKNWGKNFPGKWIWSEGITDGNNSHYALGGGEVSFGAFKTTAFLVGFHTPKVNLEFKPQQGTVFKTFIDGCNGNFSMVIARFKKQLVIDSSAEMRSFGKVSIPTPKGFITGGGVESFSARTTIEAYEVGLTGESTLIERKTFANSALEFGANYMCGGLNGL